MVALINITAERRFVGSLFESLMQDKNKVKKNLQLNMASEKTKKNNLATVTLQQMDTPIGSEDILDEEYIASEEYLAYEPMPDINSQILLASVGPQVTITSLRSRGTKTYMVKEGDTVSSIAAANGVTTNTLLWENDLKDTSVIKPGDKLTILPMTGVKHKIKSGDSLESIAKKYDADSQKIMAFNELRADGKIETGQEIFIPEGSISRPTPTPAPTVGLAYAGRTYSTSSRASSGEIESKAGAGHRFPYGYCTWYVSQRLYVPWSGNAGTWLAGARASGRATGRTPKTGAIIVTTESRWGHVGIVEKVSGNLVTISEMNYAGFGIKSTRTISAKSGVIKGYIY